MNESNGTCSIQYYTRRSRGRNISGGKPSQNQKCFISECQNPWFQRNSHGHKHPNTSSNYVDEISHVIMWCFAIPAIFYSITVVIVLDIQWPGECMYMYILLPLIYSDGTYSFSNHKMQQNCEVKWAKNSVIFRTAKNEPHLLEYNKNISGGGLNRGGMKRKYFSTRWDTKPQIIMYVKNL